MDTGQRLICPSDVLLEAGKGFRFEIDHLGEKAEAFAVRYGGRVFAYLNRCAHVSVELDWMEGEFFDDTGLYLVCSTHGAQYMPDTGVCIAGPCAGRRLIQLRAEEHDGNVYVETPA
jgi:nitrite reductase/ring-hydroxylating ferredoxin subunit